MKKLILFCMLMMVGMGVQAQKTSVKLINIDLWQDGLPNSNGMEAQGYDDAGPDKGCPRITWRWIYDALSGL